MVTVKNNGLRENEALHATWFHHVRSGCGSLLHLFFSGQVKTQHGRRASPTYASGRPASDSQEV